MKLVHTEVDTKNSIISIGKQSLDKIVLNTALNVCNQAINAY